MGGVALAGLGAFAGTLPAMAATNEEPGLSDGDVAILQFLGAAELIETDLWVQYAELAVGNKPYADALNVLENELTIYTSVGPVGVRSPASEMGYHRTSRELVPCDPDRDGRHAVPDLAPAPQVDAKEDDEDRRVLLDTQQQPITSQNHPSDAD